MTNKLQSVQDDIAYMRSLLEPGEKAQTLSGELFVNFGALYGIQTIIYWAESMGYLSIAPAMQPWIGIGPTVLSLAIMAWVLWRHRATTQTGAVDRGVKAAFIAVGVTNLALIVIIGAVAYRQQSFLIWLIYPAVVFALQGTAWLIAYMLRLQLWLGVVAGGWFLSSMVLGLLVGSDHYTLAAGVALFAFMVGPGIYMMRRLPTAD